MSNTTAHRMGKVDKWVKTKAIVSTAIKEMERYQTGKKPNILMVGAAAIGESTFINNLFGVDIDSTAFPGLDSKGHLKSGYTFKPYKSSMERGLDFESTASPGLDGIKSVFERVDIDPIIYADLDVRLGGHLESGYAFKPLKSSMERGKCRSLIIKEGFMEESRFLSEQTCTKRDMAASTDGIRRNVCDISTEYLERSKKIYFDPFRNIYRTTRTYLWKHIFWNESLSAYVLSVLQKDENEKKTEDAEETTTASGKELLKIKFEVPVEVSFYIDNTSIEELQTGYDGQTAEDFLALEQMLMCKVCLDADLCIVFLPCRHMSTCASCASVLQSCPVCRSVIQDSVKLNYE